MNTINYTEQEQKQIGLLKAWVKLSKVGGNFGKQATKTFSKDWIKLQEDFVDRLGLLGGRVYINKTMDLIEDYIKFDDKTMTNIKDCSMCDKETGIVWLEELIYCGDCSCKKTSAIGIDMNGKFIYKQQQVELKNIDWVWCCGNKIPKDMEAVGCSDCF